MCELFGVNSAERVSVNDYLREFFSHSVKHHGGWGIAVLHSGSASVEKEPVRAIDSAYLKQRLSHPIRTRDIIAHIRLASSGAVEFANCHPYVQRDNDGTCWIFAHNGTLFDAPTVDPYLAKQEGTCDSERLLLYLIDILNEAREKKGAPLDDEERFLAVEKMAVEISPGNKLNFLLHDGNTLYVHRNFADSLFMRLEPETAYISTHPLDKNVWKPVPFTTLCAFRGGRLVRIGVNHGAEYVEEVKDAEYLNLDCAAQ